MDKGNKKHGQNVGSTPAPHSLARVMPTLPREKEKWLRWTEVRRNARSISIWP
jgi:hypothetical protein